MLNLRDFFIKSYDELESTNSFALELIRSHQIIPNQIILAKKQTGGKGRYGRNWESPLGNLYFSLVLNPKNKDLKIIGTLSLVTAVAMNQAISSINNQSLKISNKWPNDILINGKKTAGILLEKDHNFVIIGIGVNINSFPKNTSYPATSLAEEGLEQITPENFLTKFLENFANLYNKWDQFGFKPVRNLWLHNAFNLNEKISVNLADKKLNGIFRNLDEEGNLLLELENGQIITISSGEVFNF